FKIMKTKINFFKVIAAIFVLLLSANNLFAQNQMPNNGMMPPPNNRGQKDFKHPEMMHVDSLQAEMMFEHFSKEMSLNEKQKTEIKALFLNHFKQLEELQKKEKEFMDKMREKHFNLKKEFESSIEKELDQKQKEKFSIFLKEKEAEMHHKNGPIR
ncbi:MAG: hypothetical protein JXA16_00275, partial [Bacteroidales bacterium]|nr:hypothetical protein [Bacteroidales bacterium]